MTAIDTATTVGDLVVQRPSRSRIFQKLGIDFCCGGKKSLADACRGKGLDPASVLQVLLASEAAAPDADASGSVSASGGGGGGDPATMSLTELCDHVQATHHAYLKEELPRLHAMIHKVAAVHGDRCPWMRDVLEAYLPFMDEMTGHMRKEEGVLFPLIRGLESVGDGGAAGGGMSVAGPIRMMEHEHDGHGQALARIRELTDGYTPPLGACNTFRATLDGLAELEADMHQHVHKENNVLFPRAQV